MKNGSSSGETFYFQLHPLYLRAEHAFAKTIKPNTNYRIAIFKGLQKCQEMKEPTKVKLVGGKIVLDQSALNFTLPAYTPNQNVSFTIKVYSSKLHNDQQQEIASYQLKSGDFVQKLQKQHLTYFREEVTLLDSFLLVFELFVNNSKIQLQKQVQQHRARQKQQNTASITRGKTPKNQNESENSSQNDKTGRQGLMKKKIVRQSGRQKRLKSSKSRDNSDASSIRSNNSMRSSQRKFHVSPHTKKDQHFLHSPKKGSPPKVEEESELDNKSTPKFVQSIEKVGSLKDKSKNIVRSNSKSKVQKIDKKEQTVQKAIISPKINVVSSINSPRSESGRVNKINLPPPSPKNIMNLQNKPSTKNLEIQKIIEQPFSFKKDAKTPLKIDLKEKEIQVVNAKIPSSKSISAETKRQEKLGQKIQISKGSVKNETLRILEKQKQIIMHFTQSVIQENTEKNKKSQNIKTKVQQKNAMQSKLEASEKKVEPNNPKKTLAANVNRPGRVSQTSNIVEKKSPRARRGSQNDSIHEEQVKQQFQKVKQTAFYVIFTIVALLLLFNAITPSRKA